MLEVISATYNSEFNVGYLRVSRNEVCRTEECGDKMLVDFDAHDEIVGIEVFGK